MENCTSRSRTGLLAVSPSTLVHPVAPAWLAAGAGVCPQPVAALAPAAERGRPIEGMRPVRGFVQDGYVAMSGATVTDFSNPTRLGPLPCSPPV